MTSGLLLVRRRRPIGEPPTLHPLGASGAATLEGTAGAGRVIHALTEAGIGCDAIHQLVLPADLGAASLESIELDAGFDGSCDATFDTVVLGSHLVNLPDDDRRTALLALAARHAGPAARLVVEHHPIDWAETAAAVEATPGGALGMEAIRREPPFVSAVSVFDIGGRVVRQPFTARVLSESELADVLARVGFIVSRRLSPTFLEARRKS